MIDVVQGMPCGIVLFHYLMVAVLWVIGWRPVLFYIEQCCYCVEGELLKQKQAAILDSSWALQHMRVMTL